VVVGAMALVAVAAVVEVVATAAVVAPFSPCASLLSPGATPDPGVSLLFPDASPGVPAASVPVYLPKCPPFAASSSSKLQSVGQLCLVED
jgi:hypothetical protein